MQEDDNSARNSDSSLSDFFPTKPKRRSQKRRDRRNTGLQTYPDDESQGSFDKASVSDEESTKSSVPRRRQRYDREKALRARELELDDLEEQLHSRELALRQGEAAIRRTREHVAQAVQTDTADSRHTNAPDVAWQQLEARAQILAEREQTLQVTATSIEKRLAELKAKEQEMKKLVVVQKHNKSTAVVEEEPTDEAALRPLHEQKLHYEPFKQQQAELEATTAKQELVQKLQLLQLVQEERQADINTKLIQLQQQTDEIARKQRQLQDTETELNSSMQVWERQQEADMKKMAEQRKMLQEKQQLVASAHAELLQHERIFEERQRQLAEVLRQERAMERTRVLKMSHASGHYHSALLNIQLQRINMNYGNVYGDYSPKKRDKKSKHRTLDDQLPFEEIERNQNLISEEKQVKSLSQKLYNYLNKLTANQHPKEYDSSSCEEDNNDKTGNSVETITPTTTTTGADHPNTLLAAVEAARADQHSKSTKYNASVRIEGLSMLENKELCRVHIRECELQKEALWTNRLRRTCPVLQKWADVDTLIQAMRKWYDDFCTLLDSRQEHVLMERKQSLEVALNLLHSIEEEETSTTSKNTTQNHSQRLPTLHNKGPHRKAKTKQKPSKAACSVSAIYSSGLPPQRVASTPQPHSLNKQRAMLYGPVGVHVESSNVHTVPIM